MSYDRCLDEILLAINSLGRHQSSIAPLPVHATGGPIFIKQNKYQIFINCKCCIKGTKHLQQVYQVYTFSVNNLSFNGFNLHMLKVVHELREFKALSSTDIAMDTICIT